MPRVNNWQEVVNHDYNLSSPKEPDRKKTITLNGRLPPLKREAVKHIHENIEALVQSGTLQSREDVLSFLQESGFEVARITPRAISVKNPDGGQNLRLKGALYDETFRDLSSLGEEYQHAQADYHRDLRENVDRAREKLTEQVQKRSEYLTGRYQHPTSKIPVRAESSLERDDAVFEKEFRSDTVSSERSAEAPHEAVVGSDPHRVHSEPRIVFRGLGWEQDDGFSLVPSGERLRREPTGDQMAGADARPDEDRHMGRPLSGRPGREIYHHSSRVSSGVHMWGETLREGWEVLRGHYDGVREAFAERVRSVAEGFQRARSLVTEFLHTASEFFGRTEQPLVEASSNINPACNRIKQELRASERDFRERIRFISDKKKEELCSFEKDINLSRYVASQGYRIDWQASHPSSAVMVRDEKKEKLIVTRLEGSEWRYFNVDKRYDKGTIIDFVQRQKRRPLGRVRETLRPWLEAPPVSSWSYSDSLVKVSTSRQNILESFYRGFCLRDSQHLVKTGLSNSTIDCERFKGMIWEDGQGNVLFPHYDVKGLSGYEILGQGFRGFSEEGVKALWRSQKKDTDQRLVIVESALNALSYHQLHGDTKNRYIATGGSMNENQKGLIESAIREMSIDSKVILAFSKNEQGDSFAQEVSALSFSAVFERHTPQMGKDWNEELQIKMQEKKLQREQDLRLERQRTMTRGYGLEM